MDTATARRARFRAYQYGARTSSGESVTRNCVSSFHLIVHMQIVFNILILLLAVAASGLIDRLVHVPLPMPLIQILVGAALAFAPLDLATQLRLDPEIFMLLVIPPLLFADGWRIPKREFFMQRRAILMLALFLVLFTVAGLGYFIHWMIPQMPLPVAFALAAVLSPTDAVALSGVAGPGRIPPHLMHILEGEALMNDASGLVAFKFAVAAAVTGVFSLRDATIGFVLIAAGGLLVGAAIAWAVSFVSSRLSQLPGDGDPAAGALVTLLIPFAAYLFAEHLGLSGILSAVSAGMAMNYAPIAHVGPLDIRVRTQSAWSLIEFVFNGVAFTLLGMQFPHLIAPVLIDAHHSGATDFWTLLSQLAAVIIVLYALRFVWVWLLRWFASRRASRQGVKGAVPGLRIVVLTTVAGVRGAITLAGVLSLPIALPDGTPLPARELAVFIASSVILASLAIGLIGLPLLTSGVRRGVDPHAQEERDARVAAADAAIRAIDGELTSLSAGEDTARAAAAGDVAARLCDAYRHRKARLGEEQAQRQQARLTESVEVQMRFAAMRAERMALVRLRGANRINDVTLNKLIREIDLSETALSTRAGKRRL